MNKMGIVYSYFANDKKSDKKIFEEIDKNSDNIITRDELDKYISKHLDNRIQDIEQYKFKYKMLEHNHKLLKEDYNILKNSVFGEEVKSSTFSVSLIKDYVESEIMSSEANSKYIPDPIERKAYISIYKTILESLTQLCNTTELSLLNHKVTIHIEPKNEN